LTCQSNRFIDASSNNLTLTVTGSPSVQRFSPFSPSSAYSTSVIGGSGYFDGNGDYLVSATSSNLAMGSGNFTVECWVYLTNTADYQYIFDLRSSELATSYLGAYFQTGSTTLKVFCGSNTDYSMGSVSLNTWNHIAVVRNGSTITTYINGVSQGTFTNAQNLSDSTYFTVGRRYTINQYLTGYIADSRVVKGTAVYTSNFTPPTAPLTAIANTQLLLNYTNGGIFDNAMMNNLETVGNAQISTSVFKYGTGSMAFDGTGDYLVIPGSTNLAMGTGDFTVELWVNQQSTWNPAGGSNYSHWLSLNNYTSGFMLRPTLTGDGIQVFVGNTNYPYTVSLSLNTWYHIAVTRASGTMRLFVNGVQIGSNQTVTYNLSTNTSNTIGTAVHNLVEVMQGYIDDLRITKGYARYTANFTPPTAAFPNQ
jgi:hypothetical protein